MKMTKNYDELSATFSFGEAGEISASLNEMPEDIIKKLALYGLGVKCSRATAGIKEEDKQFEAVKKVIEGLKAGQWATQKVSAKDVQRQVVINAVKAAGPAKAQVIEALSASGMLKKLGLTKEELMKL